MYMTVRRKKVYRHDYPYCPSSGNTDIESGYPNKKKKEKGKRKKENDAAFPNADAPTAIPLELTIGQACSLPHREGVLRCVQENKLRSLRLPISSLDQPATYRAISHSPHLLTGTPKKVSNADKNVSPGHQGAGERQRRVGQGRQAAAVGSAAMAGYHFVKWWFRVVRKPLQSDDAE